MMSAYALAADTINSTLPSIFGRPQFGVPIFFVDLDSPINVVVFVAWMNADGVGAFNVDGIKFDIIGCDLLLRSVLERQMKGAPFYVPMFNVVPCFTFRHVKTRRGRRGIHAFDS